MFIPLYQSIVLPLFDTGHLHEAKCVMNQVPNL